MNTNPLNQSHQAFNVFLSAVKKEDLYNFLITRARIGQLYDKYKKISQTLPLNDDQIIRGLITVCARYACMKLHDLTILLICGLNIISRIDLDIPASDLAAKLANQNRDTSDSNTVSRILGQITTKLPADLKEKFTHEQRLGVINLTFKLLGTKLSGDKAQISEAFKGSLVSASKYMTDDELKSSLQDNYMDDLEQLLGKDTLDELTKRGYDLQDFSTEAVTMNINRGTYEEQLMQLAPKQSQIPGPNNTQPDPTATNLNGQPMPTTRITNQSGNEVLAAGYVDTNPELHMDIKNKDLYYFDNISNSLVPLNDTEIIDGSTILSRRQLINMLKEYNLSPGEIENLYANLTDDDTIDDMRPGSNIIGSIYDDPNLPFITTTTTNTSDATSTGDNAANTTNTSITSNATNTSITSNATNADNTTNAANATNATNADNTTNADDATNATDADNTTNADNATNTDNTSDENSAEKINSDDANNSSDTSKLSVGAIVGIVIGIIVLLILIGLCIWWLCKSSDDGTGNSAGNNLGE